MQKSKRAGLTAAAVAALIGLSAACAPPPPTVPPLVPACANWSVQVDLAPTIPACATTSNYASVVKTHDVSFGYPAGTVMRVDQVDRAFIQSHGGYDLLLEHA